MIESTLWFVSIAALSALVAVWVGYPALMWLASLIFRRPINPDPVTGATRGVTVILATRESIELIASRVLNVLDTDHPAHLLNVVVALDAARADAGIAEVERIDPRVRAVIGDAPGGKAATLNAGVRAASTDLLVMADTAQRFDRRTIPVLAAAMEDTRFGAVSGALQLPRGGSVTWPIRIYWRLEKALRYFESVVHSSVGVTGAVYAVRRDLWPPIPPGVLLDDVHVPLSIVVAGHRVGFCYDAVAIESRVLSAQEERVRKVRTLTGILQLSAYIPGLLSFRRNPILLQLMGHKYARLTSPFFLVVALAAGSTTIVEVLLRQGTAAMVTLFAIVLGAALIAPLRRMAVSMFRWLFEMQVATAQAVGNAVRGQWDVWAVTGMPLSNQDRRVILYAAQTLPSSSVACAVRCFHLASAMTDVGMDVDVWSHAPGTRTTPLRLPFPSNRWPTAVRMFLEGLLAFEISLRLAWRRVQTPDVVVILSSPPFVTCFLVAHACRLLGLRYVWDARDVYPEVLFNFGVLRRDRLLGRWLANATRALYRDALFVSTPSDSFVATIRDQVSVPQRVLLIRNGFDERMFTPAARPRTDAPFVCIFHGLLGRMHNIELLLDVADRVGSVRPDVRFVVVGYGPKEKLLRAHPRSNVQFLGAKPYSQIPALLAEADLGLAFIEDTEGTDGAFPVKVYEYIGAGLPVLVTPLSEAGRLIEERGLGRGFGNQDAVGIARTIVECADRGAQYAGWREAAREERQDFSRRRWSNEFAARMQSASGAESAAVGNAGMTA